MDNAKKHWKILQELGTDLANRVRSFLVIGENGDEVIVVTEDGQGYWLGKKKFERSETNTVTKPTPLDVSHLAQMAQGNSHILFLNKRGQIYSMGKNGLGQFGLEYVVENTHFSPKLIPISQKFTSVRCGREHSLALTEDGKVWAWGSNEYGQVGGLIVDDFFPSPSPRQILELNPHRVVAVECGGWHSLALTDQGEVYGWGWNDSGQLGDGTESHTPNRIPTPSPVQSMAAGYFHTLLLTQTGQVYACGSNACGQLGPRTTAESSASLVKVAGLPPISQIASHPASFRSIAMSFDQRCFVWGHLNNGMLTFTPKKLSPFYSTVESSHSFYSIQHNTPHSVTIPAKPDSTIQAELCSDSVPDLTLPANNRLLDRIGKMFDNPDSSPDVRFQVGNQSILAHRSVLQISSGHFHQLFSADFNSPSLFSSTLQSGPSHTRHTTNPSEPEANSTLTSPQVTISITDHSYPSFYAYLRFLYLGNLEVEPEHLADLFSLSVDYFESDLQQLCLSRMRTTITPATCCLYYQLTNRHSQLPELAAFQQELVQFISTNFFEVITTAAYQSMDSDLCKKLTLSMANLLP